MCLGVAVVGRHRWVWPSWVRWGVPLVPADAEGGEGEKGGREGEEEGEKPSIIPTCTCTYS